MPVHPRHVAGKCLEHPAHKLIEITTKRRGRNAEGIPTFEALLFVDRSLKPRNGLLAFEVAPPGFVPAHGMADETKGEWDFHVHAGTQQVGRLPIFRPPEFLPPTLAIWKNTCAFKCGVGVTTDALLDETHLGEHLGYPHAPGLRHMQEDGPVNQLARHALISLLHTRKKDNFTPTFTQEKYNQNNQFLITLFKSDRFGIPTLLRFERNRDESFEGDRPC